jgi:hypothetical protein
MAEIPSTRYVKSDGVHIAYQVVGEGPFDLLFVPGFVSNIESMWQSPDQSAFFRRLASFSRLIVFDKRGTGMSDRGSQIFTLEQRMHDVQAILDEARSERAALFGVSEGGPSPSYTPPPILNEPPPWFCTAPTPSVPGRPIILSLGKTISGTPRWTISSTIGARRNRKS